MENYLDFNNKVVLVTGSTRNIGKATAELFAIHGATVIINSRGEDDIRAVTEELKSKGYKALGIAADVGNQKEVETMIKKISNELGRLDVIVNNAGVLESGGIETLEESAWERTFRTNVFGIFHITKAALPILKQRGGSIINISSISAVLGSGHSLRGKNYAGTPYIASKGAIFSLTRSLASELTEYGIRVNSVTPALVATDKMPEEMRKTRIEASLFKRVGTMEEVAKVCLFLASDLASYISGEVITLGGYIKPTINF